MHNRQSQRGDSTSAFLPPSLSPAFLPSKTLPFFCAQLWAQLSLCWLIARLSHYTALKLHIQHLIHCILKIKYHISHITRHIWYLLGNRNVSGVKTCYENHLGPPTSLFDKFWYFLLWHSFVQLLWTFCAIVVDMLCSFSALFCAHSYFFVHIYALYYVYI